MLPLHINQKNHTIFSLLERGGGGVGGGGYFAIFCISKIILVNTECPERFYISKKVTKPGGQENWSDLYFETQKNHPQMLISIHK